MGPLEKQLVLLYTEPSLQLYSFIFVNHISLDMISSFASCLLATFNNLGQCELTVKETIALACQFLCLGSSLRNPCSQIEYGGLQLKSV